MKFGHIPVEDSRYYQESLRQVELAEDVSQLDLMSNAILRANAALTISSAGSISRVRRKRW